MSSIPASVLSAIESRLPKVIDAKTHGIIDYSHSAFFLTLAILCRKSNPRAAWAALGTSALVLGQSLLTDYPLGAKPAMSFETHGKLDGGFASASWAIPSLFGFNGTKAARVFQINSLVEGAVVSMTDFNSTRARNART